MVETCVWIRPSKHTAEDYRVVVILKNNYFMVSVFGWPDPNTWECCSIYIEYIVCILNAGSSRSLSGGGGFLPTRARGPAGGMIFPGYGKASVTNIITSNFELHHPTPLLNYDHSLIWYGK